MSADGRVILVGAGPGHPGLLTLRGAEALALADCVLHDELASTELLALAHPGAERINVGKRGHDEPRYSQDEINALLVERAGAGQTVVRLKGGDPFVFGRGGEEASACHAAGIDVEVVPGVSSGLAAPAFAGIPLTDRRYSASYAVVTGHKDPSKAAEETRWAELGRAVDTLVILMGMANLDALLERVVAGGRSPDTPAAAVMNGTLPEQRVVEGTLGDLGRRVREAGLSAPAAVVVGDVVNLREELRWWERRPLFGRRVLVTRAPAQAHELCRALRAAGALPVRVPLVDLEPPDASEAQRLAEALRELQAYDAVVLASSNAVRFFFAAARAAGVDARRADYAVVGDRTEQALRAEGARARVSGAAHGSDAAGLLTAIKRAWDPSGRCFLLPRSQLGRDTLAAGLRDSGARVDARVAYHTVRPAVDGAALCADLVRRDLDVLCFASPSAVEYFAELVSGEARAAAGRCMVAAVGRTTAEALREIGLPPDVVPETPGGPELVAALAARAAQD